MKTIRFAFTGIPIRHLLFLLLGIVLGFYLFFPLKFKSEMLSEWDTQISIFSFFFGIVYLFVCGIILSFIEFINNIFIQIKLKIKRKSKINKKNRELFSRSPIIGDVAMYYIGIVFGIAISLFVGIISLIGFGLFYIFKFIWEWGFLFHLYI